MIGLGVVGLAAWVGWLGYGLYPMLAFFLVLTGYAVYRIRWAGPTCATNSGEVTDRS